MEWYEEWNDLQNIQLILTESEKLSKQNRKNHFKEIIQKEKILFRTEIGKVFLKEYRVMVLETLDDSFDEFLDDVKMMQKIIKLGIYSEDDIWETLFTALKRKQKIQFSTSLGEAFLQIYAQKVKLEKNTDYKNLEYDFLQLKRIYQRIDFENPQRVKKIVLGLTEKEEKIFDTWLGHSFIVEMQNQYLQEEKRKNSWIRKFSKAVVCILLCGMISSISIGMYIKVQSIKKYEDLRSKKEEIKTDYDEVKANENVENADEQSESKASEGGSPYETEVLEEYKEIAAQYSDFAGWLTIPDTAIDYPVMQSSEDGYYLNHDYTGEEAEEGSLFVDGKSILYPLDNFIVVYGHNMKNGDMFGVLHNYESKNYLEEHKSIHFDTKYEKRQYEVVAVLKTNILYQEEDGFRYYQTFGYQDENEFQKIVDFIKENELYDMKEELVYGDKLLILSTCEYSQENGRLVVVGRME